MSGVRCSRLAFAFRQCARPVRQMHTAAKRPNVRVRNAFTSRNPPPQVRCAGTFADNARKLFHEYPFSVTLAAITILFGSGMLVYANYYYYTFIIGAFHKYPEPVAKQLRKAVYYTNTDVQPREALRFYKQALQVAEEMGMDPFSDEIMGIKIKVAFLMEKIQQNHRAIEVLERVRSDNLAWLEKLGGLEQNKRQRTNVLGKTVAISVKLGDLYASPAIFDREMAEERLVWAVETALREKQRRTNSQVREADEGPWMSDEEMGGALEALAHNYLDKDQHYLATPLLLQALSLVPAGDCHSVVLMNNLATSLAQQSPRAARAVEAYATSRNLDARPAGPVASRQALVANARTWALKALEVAADIAPPRRTDECDQGCAVAAHNLGEFAEMSNDLAEARRRYQEAVGLARAIGFEEGVETSSARLRALAAR